MSFDLHDNSTVSTLSSAILLYGSRHGGGASFATIHPVTVDEENGAVIGAGRPFDEKALKQLAADLVSTMQVKSGILPTNVLSVGGSHIMWWSPPRRHTYFFDTRTRINSDDSGVSVGKRCGEAFGPGLIFLVKDGEMRLFAVKGKERPEAKTPLFHAPLMNVYEDGRLCTGSMNKPDSTLADSIAEWEQSFWDAAFSHPNHAKAVNYKGGLHALSIDLLDGKFRKYPELVLRSMKMTLQDVVDDIDADQGRRRR